MNLNLSQKQSNAFHYLEDNETTEIFYGGAAGGGKSYLGCIWHIYRRLKYPDTRGLIGRAKLSNLKESTLVTLIKVAGEMGYRSGSDYKYNGQDHSIQWANGSKTILKDLFFYPSDPDFTSLGSTEYTDAFIDELPEVTLKAFDIVGTRIRWMLDKYGLIPKILATGNPSPGWVKHRFVVDENRHPVTLKPYQRFIQALPTDNPDEGFKRIYIEQLNKLTSEYDKQRLLYGDWEAEREVSNPFAVAFEDKKHIAPVVHDEKKQLVIGIDFNIDPFCVVFLHYWEDREGSHCHVFDEAEIPNGSIPKMIDLISTKYNRYLPYAKITGDAMGKGRDISHRDNASLYKQLMEGLRMTPKQLEVTFNPHHKNSRVDCNYYLANFDYKVSPQCTGLISDLLHVEVDFEGSILKRNRQDVNQRADFLDAGLRYPVHNLARNMIYRHMNRK